MANRFLEKVALNAAKAREMAKAVGVIPDSESAWKYALRNLRDGEGRPLQGKALAEARVKLGDLSNNAFQKLKSIDRKQGKSSTKDHEPMTASTEFYGDVDPKGNLLWYKKGLQGSIPPGYQGNYHTQGSLYSKIQARLADKISPGVNKTGYPHRTAKPSGDFSHNENYGSRYLRDISKHFPRFKDTEGTKERVVEEMHALQSSSNASALRDRIRELERQHLNAEMGQLEASINLSAVSDKYPSVRGFPDKDLGILSLRPTDRQLIAAPKQGVVSVNKISNNGLRTVYFKHD